MRGFPTIITTTELDEESAGRDFIISRLAGRHAGEHRADGRAGLSLQARRSA